MTAPSLFADSDSHVNMEKSLPHPPESPPAGGGRGSGPTSLYRKHRPQSFDAEEFVGQEHVVRTLRNAVVLGRVAHAYLFSGPRGTGKTTTARLLAKAVNCLHEDPARRPCNACANCDAVNQNATPDIVEIDAASNRGIDDIRDLRDRVRYAPTQLPSKVYIIDEAHQITGAAANAFLKTLEEPPSHTRFVLATTDPEELLPTIVSRCQQFAFRRVAVVDIARRLRTVADVEGIAASDDALAAIARHATGSLRDALGLLEQLSLSAPGSDAATPGAIDVADVSAALGLSRNDRVEKLVEAISRQNTAAALQIVQAAIDEGEDARQLNRQLLGYLRLLLLQRAGGHPDADDRARELAAAFSLSQLATVAQRFGGIDFNIKHSPFPQLPLEIALVESTAPQERASPDAPLPQESAPGDTAVLKQPTSLRDRVRGGSSIREPSVSSPTQSPDRDPAPVTPLHPEPVRIAQHAPPASHGSSEVERIADLWPNVRADVKALNRRVEALLSEVDPVAVAGNQITLAVPYPFHRDKLNSDEVREIVARVLSRLLGREVALTCILRGEMTSAGAVPANLSVNGASSSMAPDAQVSEGDDERTQARVTAVENIFDAEEVEIDTLAARQNPGRGS